MENKNSKSVDLIQLEEIAKRNGRILLKTDRVTDSGKPIYSTCDYPDGVDGQLGTVEDLYTWETGYRSL